MKLNWPKKLNPSNKLAGYIWNDGGDVTAPEYASLSGRLIHVQSRSSQWKQINAVKEKIILANLIWWSVFEPSLWILDTENPIVQYPLSSAHRAATRTLGFRRIKKMPAQEQQIQLGPENVQVFFL